MEHLIKFKEIVTSHTPLSVNDITDIYFCLLRWMQDSEYGQMNLHENTSDTWQQAGRLKEQLTEIRHYLMDLIEYRFKGGSTPDVAIRSIGIQVLAIIENHRPAFSLCSDSTTI